MSIVLGILCVFGIRDDVLNNAGFVALMSALTTPSFDAAEQSEELFRCTLRQASGNFSALRGLGFALVAQGRESEALAVWQEIHFPAASIFTAWGNRANLEQQHDIALFWYQKAVDVDGTAAEAWHQMGCILQDSGQREQAIAAFRQALSFGYAESVMPLAWLLHQQKDYAAAINIWQRGLDDFPEHYQRLQWQRGLASSLRADKQWDVALQVAWQALLEFPDDAQLHVELGIALYNHTGETVAAVESLRHAIALNESLPGAYGAMADIMAREQRYQEALTWYSKALERKPDSKWWCVSRANMARSSEDLPLALELYRETIERFPDYAYAYYEIAWAHRLDERPAEAVDAIERALRLACTHSLQYYARAGAIYEWAGEKTKALDAYNQILSVAPNDEPALQGVERLQDQ